MGDKVDPRRQWIEKNVQFTLEEEGSILDNVAGDSDSSQVFDQVMAGKNPHVESEAAEVERIAENSPAAQAERDEEESLSKQSSSNKSTDKKDDRHPQNKKDPENFENLDLF